MEGLAASEEQCPLTVAAAAWLEGHHASLLNQEPAPAALLLELPVVDLAAGQQHRAVVEALLECPGSLACPLGCWAWPGLPLGEQCAGSKLAQSPPLLALARRTLVLSRRLALPASSMRRAPAPGSHCSAVGGGHAGRWPACVAAPAPTAGGC